MTSGQIQVSETVYPEVYVEFGNKSLQIDTKRPAMTYAFNEDKIEQHGAQSKEGGGGGEG